MKKTCDFGSFWIVLRSSWFCDFKRCWCLYIFYSLYCISCDSLECLEIQTHIKYWISGRLQILYALLQTCRMSGCRATVPRRARSLEATPTLDPAWERRSGFGMFWIGWICQLDEMNHEKNHGWPWLTHIRNLSFEIFQSFWILAFLE